MNKALKIFVGVVVFLGILSGVFLLTAKKKPQASTNVKNTQIENKITSTQKKPEVQNSTTVPKASVNPTANPTVSADAGALKAPIASTGTQERKTLVRSQWTQCKNKTLLPNTSLIWNVKITEGIPVGGTYAKGNLDNDPVYPVNIIIKSDSQNVEKIKAMLAVGKTAFLKGTCIPSSTEGTVVLQAF